jgi:hypothetical protein
MDKEDRASLISLFNNISAHILPTAEGIPANAVAPKEWWAFASWEIEPEDIGKEYRQVIQVLYPNGDPFGPPAGVNFSPQSGRAYQQVMINAMGFPVGQEGPYTLKMWLEHGSSIIFESVPIIVNVSHKRLTEMPPNFTSFP